MVDGTDRAAGKPYSSVRMSRYSYLDGLEIDYVDMTTLVDAKVRFPPAFDQVELRALLHAPIAGLAVPIHEAPGLAHPMALRSSRRRCSHPRPVVAERAKGKIHEEPLGASSRSLLAGIHV